MILSAQKAARFSVAPMLDWTDRHCRYFFRLLTHSALLYTEMVTTGAILHGDRDRHLAFNPMEGPLALQLGGADPSELARCAKIGEDYGYDEINLNVGCPSNRVQSGRFGACLMKTPELVAEAVGAMKSAVKIPVTIKCRIGVDEHDKVEALAYFIEGLIQAGCDRLIIHARKAWLQGLSPKENRNIPPLRYDVVYQMKQAYPHLMIVINGGIETLEAGQGHLSQVDGVMLGRAVYHHPLLLAGVDKLFFGSNKAPLTWAELFNELDSYFHQQTANGIAVKHLTRHVLGLFQGQPRGKQWRRYLSEHAHLAGYNGGILREAYQAVYGQPPEDLPLGG